MVLLSILILSFLLAGCGQEALALHYTPPDLGHADDLLSAPRDAGGPTGDLAQSEPGDLATAADDLAAGDMTTAPADIVPPPPDLAGCVGPGSGCTSSTFCCPPDLSHKGDPIENVQTYCSPTYGCTQSWWEADGMCGSLGTWRVFTVDGRGLTYVCK